MLEKSSKICDRPFSAIEIYQNGDVYTCCPCYIDKLGPIGNINDNSLEEIWYSKKAKNLREKMLNMDFSYCDLKHCGLSNRTILAGEIKYLDSPDLPIVVKFAQDNECNIKCITCRDDIYRKNEEELSKLNKLFEEKMLPFLSNIKLADLSGDGDPFASKHYHYVIKRLNETNPDVKYQLLTNGLLCTPYMIEKLGLNNRIEAISISMHAATKKTYKRITRIADFEVIIKNLEYVSELKKTGQIKYFNIMFVISALNYTEMVDFVKLAKKYGARACFWQYRDWGIKKIPPYRKMAVFEKYNRNYPDFVRMLQDDIFKSSDCALEPQIENLTRIKDVKAYIRDIRKTNLKEFIKSILNKK